MKARLPKGYGGGGANNIQQLARQAQKIQDDMEAVSAELEAKEHLPLKLETGEEVTIDLEDIEIFSQDIPGWSVANEGTLTVALDLTITEDLRLEGVARELIRSIQTLRKDSGFDITDRISVTVPESDDNRTCLSKFGIYIASQVLADNISIGKELTVSKV